MKKFVAVLKVWFLKEGGKISVSKTLATIAMACAILIALQAQLVEVGVAIPVALLPYFKAAAIISGLIAFVRTRNAVTTVNNKTAPTTTNEPNEIP